MKRYLLSCIFLLVSLLQTNAQVPKPCKTLGTFDRIHVDAAVSGTTKQHGIRSMQVGLNAGYEFLARVYAFVHFESNLALQNTGEFRNYFNSPVIGGGLGWRLLSGNKGKYENGLHEGLDLRIMGGGSVGDCDWRQTIYDAALQYYFKGSRMICSPTIGLGYRFTDSRTFGQRDQHTFYASIGLRF